MINKKRYIWSLSVALAGFLFGFDTVVISGANLPIKQLWGLDPWFHGVFIMSMALWGTVFGAFFGSIPCDRYGRKNTLIWIGVLFFTSAVGSAIAQDPYSFSFFRFIGGVGVGASTVASPTYISEISNKENRGKLVALYQFNIVFGILIAYFSNYLLQGVGGGIDWRLMLGVEAIPAFIYMIFVFYIPNSPRWLILFKKDRNAARKVLSEIYDSSEIELKIKQIENSVTKDSKESLFSSVYNFQILLAFLIAFFNQLSGINFVLYYAPEILEQAGFASKDSLMSSVSIGATNLLFTLIGIRLIDNIGRKKLMLIGSIGYIISLFSISWCYFNTPAPMVFLYFILIFVASHAIGQGTVIWVFISEIFPNNVRAKGQSLGTATHWIFAALITAVAPGLISYLGNNPAPIFILFGIMMILQLLFVMLMMPETKGKSLEMMKL